MSAHKTVLFDAPGPKTKRYVLVGNIVGVLLILALVAWIVQGLADKGQLSAAKWSPFLEAGTWQFYLLPGLQNTLRAAGFAILFSLVFGVVFGLGRLSHNVVIKTISSIVVEFFRAVPVLLMMIFFWFLFATFSALPASQSPFYGVVVGLTLYNGSVIAELVRSGVHSLPKGQREAASAIGMTRPQSLFSIELPQALLAMLPSLISQFVVILKDTALGYIITYPELLASARQFAAREGNVLPALLVAAAIFIVINFVLSVIAQKTSTLLSYRGARAKTVAKTQPAE